jgi:hypothetical protein
MAQQFYNINHRIDSLEKKGSPGSSSQPEPEEPVYLNTLKNVVYQKWHIKVNLVINKEYTINNIVALVDSGADMNCIQEGIVPTQYFEKTSQSLSNASGVKMIIKYKLNQVYICNKGICLETTFLCIRNLQQELILGTPFLSMIMPMHTGSIKAVGMAGGIAEGRSLKSGMKSIINPAKIPE